MRKTDWNEAYLVGTVASSKLWDARSGWNTTDGSVKLIIDDEPISISVKNVNVSKNWNETDKFNDIFTRGNRVALLGGTLGGYERKTDKQYQFKIECKMNGVAKVATGAPDTNAVTVTGTVLKKSKKGFLLSANYVVPTKKEGDKPQERSRQVKVLLEGGVEDTNLTNKVMVTGKAATSEHGAFVIADKLVSLHC